VSDDVDAIFIGGNGFRAAGATAGLEAAIDRPVVTSNQMLLWSLLAQAGATFAVSGYGRLFSHKPPGADAGRAGRASQGGADEVRRVHIPGTSRHPRARAYS
jgi:hypothetical protein